MASSQVKPSPGRPRSRKADLAIFEAALGLLGECGYQGVTMEAVAVKAGVGKSTIYRRFKGKADLISAAVARLTDPGTAPDSGDIRADLKQVLGGFHERVGSRGAPVMAALIVEERHNPELLRLFRRRVILPRRRRLRSILERAVAAGVIDSGTPLDTTVDILTGAWFSHYLSGGRITSAWTDQVVSTVWKGIGGS